MEIALAYYSWVTLKVFLSFAFVLFFFQFSGAKRQFSHMTSIDLISNFILGGILGGFIYNKDISLYGFLSVITSYFFIVYIINKLITKTNLGRRVIEGVPMVIISEGRLRVDKLKKMNLSMTDFMSLLRNKEIHSLAEVKLAQIEVGGDLTVVKKQDEDYAMLLIDNGVINSDGLEQIKKDEEWLKQEMLKKGIAAMEDVFCAQWLNNDFYIVRNK